MSGSMGVKPNRKRSKADMTRSLILFVIRFFIIY
jgi:hypothetical protein